MTNTVPSVEPATAPDDAAGVLRFAREQRAAADRAERRLLEAAVQWAVIHPAETLDDAEGYAPRVHLAGVDEQPLTLAGPGAPLVREFAVAEFGAAIGLSTEAGKRYVGHALELRYRLPRLWAAISSGELAVWRARRVAHETIGHSLSAPAAAFVDAHVAPVAHKIRPTQLDRLVEEAMARFMPELAEQRRRAAADGRHFRIDHDQISFAGTSLVTGELDLADALDLEDAIRTIARQLGDLGSTESLDVRRSVAAGELARRQLSLDLTTEDEGLEPRQHRTTSRTVLHVHLSHAALAGLDPVGRVENTRTPVTAEQVRAWCGRTDSALVVKPVIDLADHVHVEAYEVPDRIAERLALRDHTCVFPWCTRPARALTPDAHPCDCDHVDPYRPGGTDDGGTHQTCTCRLAPLCRRHHRLKTHSAWIYTILEPGTYLWSSPHGYQYLRDHEGTRDLTRERPSRRDDPRRD